MINLKKFKKIHDRNFLVHNKFYLVFVFLNTDVSVLNLLRMILEDDMGFKVHKSVKNFNLTYIYLETDMNNYLLNMTDLNEFFLEEDFKFYFVGIHHKKNYIQPDFFEKEFVEFINIFENDDDIFFFFYVYFLESIIQKKKLIFFFYNLVILNQNLFKFNVYNTPSCV